MKRFKVALISLDQQIVPDWAPKKLADEGIEFAVKECLTRQDLAEMAGDADVVWVLGSHQVLYAENLDVIPNCGAIIRTGSGTDNIPIEEATRLGIVVANTPDALTDAVAEHAIGLLFAVIRHIPLQDRAVRRGVWDRDLAMPRLLLRGQTLGLVSFGRISQAVARKLNGFDLTILAYDPYVSSEAAERLGGRLTRLDEVLSRSDFVSIHCPLTKETHHLIGEHELRQMKPEAILINTARGSVIDEAALLRALTEGWIGAAGLDVLEQEPIPPDNLLLQLDNVVITPHIAGYSDEYLPNSWRLSVETAIDLAQGRWPRSYVNPEVKPRWNLT